MNVKCDFSEMENLLEELGHVSPLLSPVRKPTRLPQLSRNRNQRSLKCELDLSMLQPSDRERVLNKLYSMVSLESTATALFPYVVCVALPQQNSTLF